MSLRRSIFHRSFFFAIAALCAANAMAAPELSFEGDTITVIAPAGTVSTNAALHLCWGAVDAGTPRS